jgi:(R)-2-hydroxyglutarate---pyruvate transhydrogenase
VVINLSKINKITHFDEFHSIVGVQAGVILEDLARYLEPRGYRPPLEIGAKGSCQLGGNLATNAGGIRFIKQNSLHANWLGMEVVLADGTVLNDMKGLRKDNTGYNLKQLFIGSEGTLGIITEALLLWHKMPYDTNVALLAVDSFFNVKKVLKSAKRVLGENLTAFEFFDKEWNRVQIEYVGNKNPLGDEHRFFLIVEASTYGEDKTCEDKLLQVIEAAGEAIVDGVIASSNEHIKEIWKLREG